MIKFILLNLVVSFNALAVQEPAASATDQARYLSETKATLEKIKSASGFEERVELLRSFEKRTQDERSKSEKAVTAGMKSKNLAELEAKELEAINWMLAFEPVFESVLKKEFKETPASRSEPCKKVPENIKFMQMPATGEAFDLSEYRKLAIETMTQFCTKN